MGDIRNLLRKYKIRPDAPKAPKAPESPTKKKPKQRDFNPYLSIKARTNRLNRAIQGVR